MDVVVIILNWNAAQDTIRCVQAISGWQTLRAGVWVVDNNSSANDAGEIAAACPAVQLIRNAQNQGFAGGNNRGIEAALAAHPATPILLLNNDAHIAEADAQRLLTTLAEQPAVGCVGPLLFDGDELLSAGGVNPVLHHLSHRTTLPRSDSPLIPADYIPGTAILIHPEVFKAVGLLAEDYFFTMEVADFCLQAQRAGWNSVIDTRARAAHTISRSAGFRSSLYPYYIIRNRFLFIRRNYPYHALLWAIWTLYSLALAAKLRLEGQAAMSRAVWLGQADGLRGRFGGQNERVLNYCNGNG